MFEKKKITERAKERDRWARAALTGIAGNPAYRDLDDMKLYVYEVADKMMESIHVESAESLQGALDRLKDD